MAINDNHFQSGDYLTADRVNNILDAVKEIEEQVNPFTEEQKEQARKNIGAASLKEVEDLLGIEKEFSVSGELIELNVDVEEGTELNVISKIQRDETWGESSKLVLHQVNNTNFVDLSGYVGRTGNVFEKNGLTAVINSDSTLTITGTNTNTGWTQIFSVTDFISDHSKQVYPAGTYQIPSGLAIQIRTAQYPGENFITGLTGNLNNKFTSPQPFRVVSVYYAVAGNATVNKTIPFGLFYGDSIPEIGYAYFGNVYTAIFDNNIYEGEYNWTTGELKDKEGNTIAYYTPQPIQKLSGTNYFWTGFGENIVSNVSNQNTPSIAIHLNDTVPEGSMPSICNFELKPRTPLCIYALAGDIVYPGGQFHGHEIPLLTTKGDFVVYDKNENVKIKKTIDSMINISRNGWNLSDRLTQNGIDKVWSKKFYITKEDYTYTYNGTNSIYTFEFDESEFAETGIPAKEDNIPVATACFYTGSNVQTYLDDRVWGGQPFPLKLSYNTETRKYIMTIRATGDNLIKYQLTKYSKAYIYYKLETPYVENEFLAMGLEAGDTFSFAEDKTEIQPYLDATEFLHSDAAGGNNAVTESDITPTFTAIVPQNTKDALTGFSNAAKIFNEGKSSEKEAAQDYSWIGDGDGTTDYTSKIQSKIKELNSLSNGGTIYLGNGTYKINEFIEVYDNIKIIGTGNTIVQQTNKNSHVLVISGSNITLKDLKLELYAMTAEEKNNLEYNSDLTACVYINSNNGKTTSSYNNKYLDNTYCKNLTMDNVYLLGSYGFKYTDGAPLISNDYEHYKGCGLIQEKLFFNYATLKNVHIRGMYHGLHGFGGANDITIFCENTKIMAYGNGGSINLNIFGHSYYTTDGNGNTISMSDEVGHFVELEQSYISEYVYDTQWLKRIYTFESMSMNNRYIVSQIGGATYYGNNLIDNRNLKRYVEDYGRGNRPIENHQNKPYHIGIKYIEKTGLTSFKNNDVITQNALSGAGVWGNIQSNDAFDKGTLSLSEICRYPNESNIKQHTSSTRFLCALSENTPTQENPIEIIIDISNRPICSLCGGFIQFDCEYIASDFTVSFDISNNNTFTQEINVQNNIDDVWYHLPIQGEFRCIYKIKITITKALYIQNLKYQSSAYDDYEIEYNPNKKVGICNVGVIDADFAGRAFLGECGGNIYGDLLLNKNSTIKNVPMPVDDNDVVPKKYVDEQIALLMAKIEELKG